MSKYARFVDCSAAQDGSDIRTTDVVDTDAYNPKPSWFTGDASFLERLYSPELIAQWKAAAQWFMAVPSGVLSGATFTGADHANPLAYVNPDNTYGDGTPAPTVINSP